MFSIIKLRAENKRLKEELAQKILTIQYLNSLVFKANSRYIALLNEHKAIGEDLNFPNTEPDNQISIHDILEN